MWKGKGRGIFRPTSRTSTRPDRFDECWDTYGNKTGRKKSATAYASALKSPASPKTCSSPLLLPTCSGADPRGAC